MTIAAHDARFEGDVATLNRDGVVGRKGAFSRGFAEAMREDMMTAFWKAIQRPGGAVGRGPRRWYVEIHPQEFGGFVELTTHPWVVAMCEARLQDRRDRLRHTVPGREEPAVAPRLPVAAGNLSRPSHHLAGLQPDRRRRDRGHGAVPGVARHAVCRRARVETRDVPAAGHLGPVRRKWREEISEHGRYLVPLGADRASRNGASFADRPAGHGAGRRRTGRRP